MNRKQERLSSRTESKDPQLLLSSLVHLKTEPLTTVSVPIASIGNEAQRLPKKHSRSGES